ncbi:MAG: S46 family peptidase [Chlorobi bacterium]|nr:S46 family peptidase [Chlorobiota bacterium]
MKKSLIVIILCFLFVGFLRAKEGMWIPLLLGKYNIEEMQQMGFRLTAKDIYDINNSSMKDAIVFFGRGCTGELVSGTGLILTNHHCGYRSIQSHSTLEDNYLANGFWAMSKDEELPNEGLSVKLLESMEDVTEKVLMNTDSINDIDLWQKRVDENIQKIEGEASNNGKLEAMVKPLFYGNQYFLYTFKVYKDVRLVGAPPSSIGKFGGDTDNWMWPRHTGDFSVFRIYADADNQPAEYSKKNVPYKPKYFLPISLKGVSPGDFTLVYGFPGRTMEYLFSDALDLIMNQRDPWRIRIRDKKKAILAKYMDADPKVRIQYSAKYSGVTNAWKKWQGEINGLKRLGALDKKVAFEEEFKNWAIKNKRWDGEFLPVFESLRGFYSQYGKYIKASDYYSEIIWKGVEVFSLASKVDKFIKRVEQDMPGDCNDERASLLEEVETFYKDFDLAVDKELFEELFPMLVNEVDAKFIPDDVKRLFEKQGVQKLKNKIYGKSVLANPDLLRELIRPGKEKQLKKLKNDPVVKMYRSLRRHFNTGVAPYVDVIENSISTLMKQYLAGIMEMKKGQPLYPDANGTLRVSYGKVEGYEPRDGVYYKYSTSLKGVMEKDGKDDDFFDVPEKLKKLYESKDFGNYAANDTLSVCFVASNHTSGGNSGSPVINAYGQLIGINFDRCWEGTMSDIMFDPERCRNIALDIRYALFIIDKFAGAGYLLDEMEIVD